MGKEGKLTMDEKNVKSFIEARENCEQYAYFKLGDEYYKSRNTQIEARKKKVFVNQEVGVMENPFGANHRLPSGHFKKVVDQKVMFLLGNGVIFQDDETKEVLDEYFEDSFDEMVLDMGTDASIRAEAWLLAYYDKGKLKFRPIPAQQIYPEYDEFGRLTRVARRFDEGNVQVALLYDENKITRYEKRRDRVNFVYVNDFGHFTKQSEFNGKVVGEPEEHGFGEVPFIPLYNNREHLSDLYRIKAFIDVYDVINSDFANNIDDMQDAFFTLKNYSGDAKNIEEFMTELKRLKAVPVGEDGEVGVHQLQVPVQAREAMLDRLERDIYKFSMAVDLSGIEGGSITNVYIKAMFADLDLKSKQFESEVRKFIYKVIDFINVHDQKNIEKDFGFDRSFIVNNAEMIESYVKLSGIVSNQTIREVLPIEMDLEEEEARIAKQNGEVIEG